MSQALRFGRNQRPYDVIVCGAGHAGCEAALMAARMGADTLLLSGNIDTIAQMSCNPAIGGQAKGHMVREIDALGGEMAVNTDTTAIQFRLLNATKGPAVRAPRAQCDKKAYQFRMKHTLELQENLTVFQAMVNSLVFEGDRVMGVKTSLDVEFLGQTVIITTGTFLRGVMHIGSNQNKGGRLGDFSAEGLSASFIEAGIELERLKTGTPPRILGRSVDTSVMVEQPGDPEPCLFAFYDTRGEEDLFHVEHFSETKQGWKPGTNQVSCWMTETSADTATIIRENLHRSPLYGGMIEGVGPRYCPSIEDKIVKFADKPTHRLFLEPEGRHTDEWYINGFSTSLPFDIQTDLLRTVPGLENVQMLRPAYAVEYDFAPPTQLHPWLESKKVENLFFSGQINGTSGYEEAAGQGLVAGANAVLKLRGEPPMVIGRNEAYIGVLIDDLVTKGTREPYRMFTSRAEYRLLLNHESAELRLHEHARRLGAMPKNRLTAIENKQKEISKWLEVIEIKNNGRVGESARRGEALGTLLPEMQHLHPNLLEEISYRVLYRGYLERELRQLEKWIHLEKIKIPATLDYQTVHGLKAESRHKLADIRPATLGQARRISGVNPADISILLVHLSRPPTP